MLISCTVTAQLICTFGFAYADGGFSDAVAEILFSDFLKIKLPLFCFQNEIMEAFHNGKAKKCFDLWHSNLSKTLRDTDSVAQKLEFYLNIYFAIYPLKFGKGQV